MTSGMILAPLALVLIFALIACRPVSDPAKRKVQPRVAEDASPAPLDEFAEQIARKSEPYN